MAGIQHYAEREYVFVANGKYGYSIHASGYLEHFAERFDAPDDVRSITAQEVSDLVKGLPSQRALLGRCNALYDAARKRIDKRVVLPTLDEQQALCALLEREFRKLRR